MASSSGSPARNRAVVPATEWMRRGMRDLLAQHSDDELAKLCEAVFDIGPKLTVDSDVVEEDDPGTSRTQVGGPLRAPTALAPTREGQIQQLFDVVLHESVGEAGYYRLLRHMWEGILLEYWRSIGGRTPSYKTNVRILIMTRWKEDPDEIARSVGITRSGADAGRAADASTADATGAGLSDAGAADGSEAVSAAAAKAPFRPVFLDTSTTSSTEAVLRGDGGGAGEGSGGSGSEGGREGGGRREGDGLNADGVPVLASGPTPDRSSSSSSSSSSPSSSSSSPPSSSPSSPTPAASPGAPSRRRASLVGLSTDPSRPDPAATRTSFESTAAERLEGLRTLEQQLKFAERRIRLGRDYDAILVFLETLASLRRFEATWRDELLALTRTALDQATDADARVRRAEAEALDAKAEAASLRARLRDAKPQ